MVGVGVALGIGVPVGVRVGEGAGAAVSVGEAEGRGVAVGWRVAAGEGAPGEGMLPGCGLAAGWLQAPRSRLTPKNRDHRLRTSGSFWHAAGGQRNRESPWMSFWRSASLRRAPGCMMR